MSPVTRIGAFLPGIAAVVMTTSVARDGFHHHLALAAVERFVLRGGVSALVLRVRDLNRHLDEARAEALNLLLDGRAHVVRLDPAPSRRAVAMACNPATPAPTTNTRAAATVPAAVLSIGNIRGSVVAATRHRLVPDDRGHRRQRVHALGARDARHELHRGQHGPALGDRSRGRAGRQRLGKPDDELARSHERNVRGAMRRIRAQRADGGDDLRLRTHPRASRSLPGSAYAASGNPAASPAPRSMTTSMPSFFNAGRTAGTMATRRSPGNVSVGTPSFIAAEVYAISAREPRFGTTPAMARPTSGDMVGDGVALVSVAPVVAGTNA